MTPRKVNVAYALENFAKIQPKKTAIVCQEKELTYRELDNLASKFAANLQKMGIGRDDKVAVSCPNTWHFPIIYYGILKLGGVVVPLNILLKRKEIEYFLRDSNAIAYICYKGEIFREGKSAFKSVNECKNLVAIEEAMGDPDAILFKEMLKGSEEISSVFTSREDTAVILYTSGTTGTSKGAELTHGNLFENALALVALMQLTSKDTHLVTLPLFHSFGQTVQLNAGLLAGCKLVLQSRFEGRSALDKMIRHRATIFVGVPTMYWSLLNEELEDHEIVQLKMNLRLGVSGGAAMPIEVLKGFEEKFGVIILESYGLSETSPVACFSRSDLPRKVGSIGVPVPGSEMIIGDDQGKELPPGSIGEILIKGHHIMKGYYKRDEETRQVFKEGWFHTGDLGKMDEDGYFYVVDRKKDLIIRGGYNVYPREIEEMLITHPKISLVAVVGESDEKYGEEIAAHIVPIKGEKPNKDEIITWCKERMAAFKYPRKIYFHEDLPKTATGKILKRALKTKTLKKKNS